MTGVQTCALPIWRIVEDGDFKLVFHTFALDSCHQVMEFVRASVVNVLVGFAATVHCNIILTTVSNFLYKVIPPVGFGNRAGIRLVVLCFRVSRSNVAAE